MTDRGQPSTRTTAEQLAADLAWLREADAMARPNMGRTWPNPPVGCVIVGTRNGAPASLGRGAHTRAGDAHAEVVALQAAGDAARGATAYVTLEPCAHHGRTPPCTDALLRAGVARVVFAADDPNPAAAGGATHLRANGVVADGPTELRAAAAMLSGATSPAAGRSSGAAVEETLAACEATLGPFLAVHRRGRPWVVAKWAMTLDGRIATRQGHSKWITGEAARQDARLWRARLGAVLIGSGTARADDPLLTYRGANEGDWPPPTRIVLDTYARLSPAARLLGGPGRSLIAVGARTALPASVEALTATGAQVVPAAEDKAGRIDLTTLMPRLWEEHGVMGVLLEGGATVLGSAFDAHLVDYAVVYMAPRVIGGSAALGPVGGDGAATIGAGWRLHAPRVMRCGDDLCVEGHVRPAGDAT